MSEEIEHFGEEDGEQDSQEGDLREDAEEDSQEENESAEEEQALPETFDELLTNETLREAVAKLGFVVPTPVQQAAVPRAIAGKDLIVQAKTGSGKTVSFVLPLLTKLFEAQERGKLSSCFALVVTPTRELAFQVNEVISSLTDSIKPVCLIGGADIEKQIAQLKENPSVVVGTPGRILDLLRQKKLRLNKCRYFVLDEADEMLSMGFLEDVRVILSRLPDKRQGLLVSATITPRVDMMAHSFLSRPERVVIDEPEKDLPSIEHRYCNVAGDLMAKPAALCDLIETLRPHSTIIFCNTKSDTQLVEALLRRRGFDARRINSDLSQRQRDRIMKKIRAQELSILVATDIAARGLDIEQIELVINYSIHEQPEIYVHRTGRTGRAGRSGRAISLVGPHDFGAFHFLTKVLDISFEQLELPTDTEIADARLTHLYEIIRESKLEVEPRDSLVARQLLRELGQIEEPTEELEELISKLCKYSVERFIAGESVSLDEELEAKEESSSRKKGKDSRERRDRGDRKEGRRKSDRGRDRDSRSKDRSERRRGEGRSGRGGNRDDNRSERSRRGRREDSGRSERRGRSRDDEDGPAEEEYRLYIGQGRSHGLDEEIFGKFASEYAEISKSRLRKLTIREHYGFVDLLKEDAQELMRGLNGIDHNGEPLVMEFAADLSQRKSRGPRNRSSRSRE